MIVMKFGGTSVGTAERLRTACSLVKSHVDKNPVIVVSAHNSPECRMTNSLIAAAEEALAGKPDSSTVQKLQRSVCDSLGVDTALIDPLLEKFDRLLTGIDMIGEISPRTMDVVMSFGERMSCPVFADVLRREFDVNVEYRPSFELGLMTDSNFGSAKPNPDHYPEVAKAITDLNADVVVTTGFLGRCPDGHITTLGRGGSDYSGTIFGAIVGAEEVQIWTDVDGVMTADPSVVPAASSIPELSFKEASELAWYGAKVLHPATMLPAMEHDIPVRVMNTYKPEHSGTLILPEVPGGAAVAKSVVYKEGIELATITSTRMLGTHGFMAKVFDIFRIHEIDIHMIATSETSISLTVPKNERLLAAAEELKDFAEVSIEQDKAIVCVIGEKMAGIPGVASRVTTAMAMANVNIRMISQGARELNIALVIDEKDILPAIKSLHQTFFEED